MRILLLEDDPAIARTVAYALERDGLSVVHCLLVEVARRTLAAGGFDLAVLDIGLPDGSGLDLCRELRATGRLPVILLSARGEEIDRVLGLELGADDYVAKPFSPRELLARVRALLRRSAMATTAATPRDEPPLAIDVGGQRASLRGQALTLTRREFRLLATLVEAGGRVLSRERLLEAAWGDDSDSLDRTVDTHVKTLRAKLRAVDAGHEYIVTHRGMGYSLVPPAR